jgi:hypothetical protein
LSFGAEYFVSKFSIRKHEYQNIQKYNWPVILYGYEIWSLTLSLRVFQNRALREILGPWRNKVTGEWRRLHNKEPYYLYSSPNIFQVIKSTRIEMGGVCGTYREGKGRERKGRGANRVLVVKPKG